MGRKIRRYEQKLWAVCDRCGAGWGGGKAKMYEGKICRCDKGTYHLKKIEVLAGEEYICSCGREAEERHDRYGIYAGIMCDKCWRESGIANWTFDPAYAGECLEAEDY